MQQQATGSRPRLGPFLLWLGCFYAAWAAIIWTGGLLVEVREHWPIAAAMAAGSYFAGSTPMGGGTIGFPVLVLLFDQPASLGRDFSFAVQSIGMTSASILILCWRTQLDWAMLGPALAGAVVGTPLGLLLVAPFVPNLAVKLLFAVLWASFGILHLARVREIVSFSRDSSRQPLLAGRVAFTLALVGGATVTATTGVGVDMLLYVFMVLLFRLDLKVAIPSSVLLMSAASLVGIAARGVIGVLDPSLAIPREVFLNWLAAAPIVALGAPFGALMVTVLPRALTLRVVSVLCLGQLAWTLWDERAAIDGSVLAATVGAMLALGAAFWALYLWGSRIENGEGAALTAESQTAS